MVIVAVVVVVRNRSSFGAPTSSYSTTMMFTYYYLELMNLSHFLSVSLLLGAVYVSVSVCLYVLVLNLRIMFIQEGGCCYSP